MSHFSRLKTHMIEKEFLLKALLDLGYEYEEGDVKVTGFQNDETPVEIRVPLRNSYDIGFRKAHNSQGQEQGHYEIVADWWGVTGIQQKEFTNALMQRYAYHATLAKLEQQGFSLVNEESGDKGQIRLVMRRSA
jgi:hypothetical protein